jgi:hypothetical protein
MANSEFKISEKECHCDIISNALFSVPMQDNRNA